MVYVDAKGRPVEVALGQLRIPLPEYEKNLRAIAARLKATGARLIFATTTPVPTECVFRYAGEERPFNDVAMRVMKEMNVEIDDLATFAREQSDPIQIPHNVHYTETGYIRLAEKVSASMLAAIEKR